MNLAPDLVTLLSAHVEHVGDEPLLLLTPASIDDGLGEPANGQRIVFDDDFDPARDLVFDRRYRLAIVIDAPAIIGRTKTRELLARLRNIGAQGVLAAFRHTPLEDETTPIDWSMADFLGLGFRRAENARSLQCPYWLYRYNIHDYKITPDWLNSRYWANPERWERDRW